MVGLVSRLDLSNILFIVFLEQLRVANICVRSSNNGIAAIINPIGIIEEKVEFGNTGYVDLKENRKIQSTIFSKLGNKIFLIIILFYVLLIFLLIKLQKGKN